MNRYAKIVTPNSFTRFLTKVLKNPNVRNSLFKEYDYRFSEEESLYSVPIINDMRKNELFFTENSNNDLRSCAFVEMGDKIVYLSTRHGSMFGETFLDLCLYIGIVRSPIYIPSFKNNPGHFHFEHHVQISFPIQTRSYGISIFARPRHFYGDMFNHHRGVSSLIRSKYYDRFVTDYSHLLKRLYREFPSKNSTSNNGGGMRRVDCSQFMDYINRLKPYRV